MHGILILGVTFENGGDGNCEVFVTSDTGSMVLIFSNWRMDSFFVWMVKLLSHKTKARKLDGHPTKDKCSGHHTTMEQFLLGMNFVWAHLFTSLLQECVWFVLHLVLEYLGKSLGYDRV